MAKKRTGDISPAKFRQALKANGFVYHTLSRTYSDVRVRGAAAVTSVMRGRRVDRRATLGALFAARAAREAEIALDAAARAEQRRLAATIAPLALPPPRDRLEGSAAIAQLADDLVVITTRSDAVTYTDLRRIGWLPSQIDAHAEAARSLAYFRQNGAAA